MELRPLNGKELPDRLPEFVDSARQVDSKHHTTKSGTDVIAARSHLPGPVLLAAAHRGRMAGAVLSQRYRDYLHLSIATGMTISA